MTLEAIAARRWRLALGLSTAMLVVYLCFVLLVAFDKPFLGTVLVPGLSIGILLGGLVIVFAWLVTWTYIRWANRHYDAAIRGLKR